MIARQAAVSDIYDGCPVLDHDTVFPRLDKPVAVPVHETEVAERVDFKSECHTLPRLDQLLPERPQFLNRNISIGNFIIIYPEQVDLEDMVSFSDPMGNA